MEDARPFQSSLEHLFAELERIDRLLRAAVRCAREAGAKTGEMRALIISDAEIDALHETPLLGGKAPTGLARARGEAERMATALAARVEASARQGVESRLELLRRRFALDRFDTDVLLLALLPEIDVRYGRLIAYLEDDLTRKRPSVTTALSLSCATVASRLRERHRFLPDAPLVRHGLVQLIADAPRQRPPLLAQSLEIDARIVEHLFGSDAMDASLAPYARLLSPRAGLDAEERLRRFVTGSPESGPILVLRGPRGSDRKATAEALCRELGVPLLLVDGHALLTAGKGLPIPPSRFTREARLLGAALCWDGADLLLDETRSGEEASLRTALAEHPGHILLCGDRGWEPIGTLSGRPFVPVDLPMPSAPEQARQWAAALGEERPLADGVELESFAERVRLTGERLQDAAATALALARLRAPEGGPLELEDLLSACRMQHRRGLGSLARRLETPHRWSDLVLPRDKEALLRELCAHVHHRSRVMGAWGFERKLPLGRGLGVLFAGPPGTGKTMAAGVIAAELGLELYHVDLSTLVSKYIGETEKHLKQLFDAAEENGAILFFDEADAIFGKRTEVKDSHDRYANQETSYLLQRIDAYEGMVILASNMQKNMDDAFVRRLRFVVDFPLPGEAERLRIWERLLPPELPREADVDLGFLSWRLEVAGGHIRNIALAAAFLAASEGTAMGMRHLLHAARREYVKMGRVVDSRYFSRQQRPA